MTTTLQKQAWLSGLVLLDDETPEWNFEDWPPLEGGWRWHHATVIIDHPDNNKEQTVVVLGGYRQAPGATDSVLVLNLSDPDRQWREGPPMNKKRGGHAAALCNGGVYVMGGFNRVTLDCIERIDANDLLQSSLTTTTTHESHWTTLTCRLSTRRNGCCAVAVHDRYIVVMGGCYIIRGTMGMWRKTLTCRLSTQRRGCCAVAVHNRYIVVMGGHNNDRHLSSVDIIDTNNHTVTAGPSMTVPRQLCGSAVIRHRIFVVGGHGEHGNVDSVEYLDYATPCDNHETKEQTGSSFISFSPTWTTQSELRLSNARSPCAVVAVGSCLVVVGRPSRTVEVLDTHRNRVWNLPGLQEDRWGCSMVSVANQVAVIGGWENPSCATLPLLDRKSWCFRRLCEHQSNRWYHSLENAGIRDEDISPFFTSTSTRKRARSNTHRGDEGMDEAY